MNKEPLLSICIPTHNRSEQLKATLESITNKSIFTETNNIEIAISDNASTDNTPEFCSWYLSKYPDKITYKKNSINIEDRNFEAALRLGKGKYLKLLNDNLLFRDGALEELVKIISATQEERPILFFLNGAKPENGLIKSCNSLSEFINSASYYSTWIGGFGIWRSDLDEIDDFSRRANLKLIQTDVLFRLFQRKSRAIVLGEAYFGASNVGRKSGYNIAKVFGENYIYLLKEQVYHGSLSEQALQKEMQLLLANHIIPFYFTEAHDFSKDGFIEHLRDYFNEPYFYEAVNQLIESGKLTGLSLIPRDQINNPLYRWRFLNQHNETSIPAAFDFSKVWVGKRTYGVINVQTWFHPDEKLTIGSYVSIAANVIFMLGGNHPYEGLSTFPFKVKLFGHKNEATTKGPIDIGSDVWIGNNATILSGVTIGQGAVIAAGSVVARNIEPYAIYAGNPARLVKYRFAPDIIEELLKIDYNNIDEEVLFELQNELYEPITDIETARSFVLKLSKTSSQEIDKTKKPLRLASSQKTARSSQNKNWPTYDLWKERKSLQEIDGQVLAEHLQKWEKHPVFNIIVEIYSGEDALLADTLDSLGAQWYPHWHLTIVADFPATSSELAEIPQISWIHCHTDQHAIAINEAIHQLPGDWLFLMEAGCKLEPHALAYFGDTLNLYPSARLIYCDEDQLTAEGNTANPHFKPDFNLELLRGMYYLGPCLMVERTAFAAAGGLELSGTAGLYDLSLKLADSHSRNALVHLPEILLHTPEIGLRSIDPETEQTAVRNHIARQGIGAKIDTGLLSGTQKITYTVTGPPLVSIIIPTRDNPGYLVHCVESLLRETSYQNWELIIVDHGSSDPDAIEYISSLLERKNLPQRVECVRTDGEFNYARLCNLGASVAHGDYLLFLDNDTEIIQPSWLTELLGHAQQKDVAAVAPRLAKPDNSFSQLLIGPRILGVRGLCGGVADEKTNLLTPGHNGRLQVAQEVSAVSGSCILLAKDTFDSLGRLNEQETPVYESILDLCIRLREKNHLIIWTPWVNVVHHDGISRKRLEGDLTQRTRLSETVTAERNYLLANHIKTLANDPYYHRQLSLNTAFALEPNVVIDWDTRFHDRLRILGQPLDSGSGEYRMSAPFRALQKAGLAQTNTIHLIGRNLQKVLTPIELVRAAPDVFMLQQAIEDLQINQLKDYRRFSPDIFVTYAVDDVLGNLPRKHYLHNFQAREGKSRMREGLSYCNRLIASTEPIAEYCRNMIDDIVVVPNRLEGAVWCELKSDRGTGKKPRVGWAGAQQHLGDLELIKQVVEELADEVEWVFMGMCPDFLKPYVFEEHPFVPLKDYPTKLASLNLDLAIAPLEQHLFNEGKSNLRLLEYGAMGWPVICTDIYPYQTNNAPVKRLPNVASTWIEAIRERINDLDAAYREGDELKAWVLKHYILEDHIEEWLQAVTPSTR